MLKRWPLILASIASGLILLLCVSRPAQSASISLAPPFPMSVPTALTQENSPVVQGESPSTSAFGPNLFDQFTSTFITHTVYLPLIGNCYSGENSPSFGVQLDIIYNGDVIQRLSELGAKTVRTTMDWAEIEPTLTDPPTYNWTTYDEKFSAFSQAGLAPIVIIGENPSWAAPTVCGPLTDTMYIKFAEFLTEAVNRYKNPPYNVKYWEIYNEPDDTWYDPARAAEVFPAGLGHGCWGYYGGEYAYMLSWAYPAIKAADPEAKVLLGGLAYDWFTDQGGPFYRYFIDDVLNNGGGNYFDYMNFHYFPPFHAYWNVYGKDIIGKTNYLRNKLAWYGVDKPFVVTETAERGHPDDSASMENQASYVVKVYTRGMAAGLKFITWWALIGAFRDEDLLYDDFTPKPAYYAYQVAARELDGWFYLGELSTKDPNVVYISDPNSIEGYIFATSACSTRKKMVLWSESGVPGMVTFYASSQIRVSGKYGGSSSAAEEKVDSQENIQITVQVTSEPIYVEIIP